VFFREFGPLWDWLVGYIIPVILLVIIKNYLMAKLVFRRWVMTPNGFVRRPASFTVMFGAMTFVNFILGAFFAITRIVSVALGSGLSIAFRVDKTVSKEDELSDVVYTSLLALVQCTNEVQNPTFVCATRALCPAVHDTWLPPDPEKAETFQLQVPAEAELGSVLPLRAPDGQTMQDRARRLRVRNKFWLLVTLARNPPCEYNGFFNLANYRWYNFDKERKDQTNQPEIELPDMKLQEVGAVALMVAAAEVNRSA